jgi:hypothetical protein
MKAKLGRSTRRQQQWLTHLRRAEARKMPLAQYCRAQGLSVQSLYNARYELTQQERRSTASKPAPKKSRSTNPFVAVQMASSPAVPAAVCRVHLKDVTIECANLPPPAWLAQLAMGASHAVP